MLIIIAFILGGIGEEINRIRKILEEGQNETE